MSPTEKFREAKFQVHIPRRVEKELLELPSDVHASVRKTLEELRADSRPPGCKKLKGRLQCWRVRVGAYRILYDIDTHQHALIILKVGPRKDVYRSFH